MTATDASAASAEPLPVLHHDGSRLDWLTAQYKATVALKQRASTVIHELIDGTRDRSTAEGWQRRIRHGSALPSHHVQPHRAVR